MAKSIKVSRGAHVASLTGMVFPVGSQSLAGSNLLERAVDRIGGKIVVTFGLFLGAFVSSPQAQPSAESSSKLGYSLFYPVPENKLRELSTDRPGKSHSSITVDVGHFQIESDFLNYTYDPHGSNGVTTRAYSVGTPILKLGITNWMDLELGTALFNGLRQTGGGGAAITAHGFGDTFFGAKINAFGNDGGEQSLAVLPFLKLPTAASGLGNGFTEFTVNVPYTIALSTPWSLTIEPNAGVLRNSDNTSYRGGYGLIANLNRPVLTKGLTLAVELAVDGSTERTAATKMSFDPSLQYLIGKNFQLDVGVYLGLNNATPRYNPYVGVSYRF